MRVLVFGDSITQGIWDSRTGWVGYVIEDYNTQYLSGEIVDPPSIFNLGISADTSQDVLNRFEGEVQARSWEDEEFCFIFSIGVNKTVKENNFFWSTPEEYKNDLIVMLEKAKIYSNKIIFLGLTGCDETNTLPVSWGDYWYSNKRITEFDSVLKVFCKENNLPYIELINLFKNREGKLLFDGLHPNTQGHKLIYETVKPELEKLLALA